MIEKLIAAIEEKNAPICVGLDPALSMVPKSIIDAAKEEKGDTLEAAAEALFVFNSKIIDAVCDVVPSVKIQSAMYERFGVPGVSAFKRTIDYSHEKGLIVIGDVKRGDIGSTSEAYADAHIGKVKFGEAELTPFGEDFCTVNPYLGTDGIKPFAAACAANDKGIFVLVKTSNPSSAEFQDRRIRKETGLPVSAADIWSQGPGGAVMEDEPHLYELVGHMVNTWGEGTGSGDYSEVGAVVGATFPEIGELLRKLMKRAYILVPGYGAQGGTGKDLKPFFDKNGLGAVVNSSRGIIAAWQRESYKDMFDEAHFADAARRAVLDMKQDISKAIGK